MTWTDFGCLFVPMYCHVIIFFFFRIGIIYAIDIIIFIYFFAWTKKKTDLV